MAFGSSAADVIGPAVAADHPDRPPVQEVSHGEQPLLIGRATLLQHASFLKIPNLRVMNRVPKVGGMRPVIEAFSGQAVLGVAYGTAHEYDEIVSLARPDTRFLFCVLAMPLEEARRRYEQMRVLCPRIEA